MAPKQGERSQIGIVDEVTYGTAVTVTRFFEFTKETIKRNIENIMSKGIRAGRMNTARSGAYARWDKGSSGPIEMEVSNRGFGIWLKHMLGAVNTTGGGPTYSHAATEASLVGDFFTCQVGRDDAPFTYAGCKVTDWSLGAKVGELLMLSVSIDAQSESTAIAKATASYPTGLRPYSFLDGALTVGGAATSVSEFKLDGKNQPATERYFLGSPLKKEPTDQGRERTGTLTLEFEDLTAYNLFVNGTESALVLTCTAGADTLTITCPAVLFTGETPTVDSPEIIPLTLPFIVLGDGLAITMVNADAVA